MMMLRWRWRTQRTEIWSIEPPGKKDGPLFRSGRARGSQGKPCVTLDSPPVAGEPPRMRRRAILTFACASLMLGCAHHPGASPQDAVAPTEGWSLTVVNHHWLDVSVTLIADGLRSRLGTGGATRTANHT